MPLHSEHVEHHHPPTSRALSLSVPLISPHYSMCVRSCVDRENSDQPHSVANAVREMYSGIAERANGSISVKHYRDDAVAQRSCVDTTTSHVRLTHVHTSQKVYALEEMRLEGVVVGRHQNNEEQFVCTFGCAERRRC